MTGKAGFSTTVVLVTIMERGSQSFNLRSLISGIWAVLDGVRVAAVSRHKAAKRFTKIVLPCTVPRRVGLSNPDDSRVRDAGQSASDDEVDLRPRQQSSTK